MTLSITEGLTRRMRASPFGTTSSRLAAGVCPQGPEGREPRAGRSRPDPLPTRITVPRATAAPAPRRAEDAGERPCEVTDVLDEGRGSRDAISLFAGEFAGEFACGPPCFSEGLWCSAMRPTPNERGDGGLSPPRGTCAKPAPEDRWRRSIPANQS